MARPIKWSPHHHCPFWREPPFEGGVPGAEVRRGRARNEPPALPPMRQGGGSVEARSANNLHYDCRQFFKKPGHNAWLSADPAASPLTRAAQTLKESHPLSR